MKKFWPAIGALTILTILSFFIDENVRSLMVTIRNPTLDAVMFFFSSLGGLTIGVPFIIIAVALLEMKRKNKIALNLIMTLAIDITLTTILKLFIGRDRPPNAYETDGLEVYMSSFPSAHSSRAFAMFSLLNSYYKRPILLYLIASIIAFSRLYFGVHYLSDILAGTVTGLIVARFVIWNNPGERLLKMFKKP